jgi:hypothetical protein
MTQEGVRAFALSLPEAHEQSHFGRPDVRVRNKIFATFPDDGRTVNLKTTPVGLDMLSRSDPSTYRDVWGGRWVGVDLSRADPAELLELLVEAYSLAAPKKLVAEVKRLGAAVPKPRTRASRK